MTCLAAASILLLTELVKPGATLSGDSTALLAVIYGASSLLMTLMLTVLIVGRLLLLRHRLRTTLGTRHETPYLSVSAMLVESSLLYSVFALLFLVLFAKNDPGQNIIFPVLGQVQVRTV